MVYSTQVPRSVWLGRSVFSSTVDLTRSDTREPRGYLAFFSPLQVAAKSLFNTLLPGDCRICSAPLAEISRLPVCSGCLESIQPTHGELCGVCGERLHHFTPPTADVENICGMCRRARPAFIRAVAFGGYDGALRELIHLLKYENVRPAAGRLGMYLAQAINRLNVDLDGWIAVPVPMHRARRRQRGFNQAELIAKAAQRRLRAQVSVEPGLLERRRETSPQTGLTNHQRRANLRGAFVTPRPDALRNRQVLLVDDVLTTGTTVAECTRVLLRAGARTVAVATVARVFKGEPARGMIFSNATEIARAAEAMN